METDLRRNKNYFIKRMITKNIVSFNENEIKQEDYKKIKAKFEEINGDYLDSNITEEEFNYLLEKSNLIFNFLANLEYVSKMFEKYIYLREDSINFSNSFSNSKNSDSNDISLFSKKFSAMLLEIGCVI